MTNLPSWISVEEHLPDNEQYIMAYREKHGKFYVTPVIYISDVRSVIAKDEDFRYMFSIKEIENNINSGFFSYDDYDGTYYMYIIHDVKYWMPTYGSCDTATSDR